MTWWQTLIVAAVTSAGLMLQQLLTRRSARDERSEQRAADAQEAGRLERREAHLAALQVLSEMSAELEPRVGNASKGHADAAAVPGSGALPDSRAVLARFHPAMSRVALACDPAAGKACVDARNALVAVGAMLARVNGGDQSITVADVQEAWSKAGKAHGRYLSLARADLGIARP